jgi:hypothetical protein
MHALMIGYSDVNEYLAKGRQALKEKNYSTAKKYLQGVLVINPKHIEAEELLQNVLR